MNASPSRRENVSAFFFFCLIFSRFSVASIKLINDQVQFSTVFKDTRELADQAVSSAEALLQGEEPEVNDTESYDNGSKIVPAFLLDPVIVTKENAADVYKDDETLFPLTQG